ncbi:hypothetical protein [Robiginitalea sp. SC105]|uniref:hypothetical protein n=1 Tax=Robiginitalea sp. SC105 TaxID=2762332 RepID=UPI0016399AFA|nr:hypothetical protein [Robiginitalea sp. SC105]MBC2839267.1 hypothetical protein [Robiginitalea sp. SC105]
MRCPFVLFLLTLTLIVSCSKDEAPPDDLVEATPVDGAEETPGDGTEETPADGTEETPGEEMPPEESENPQGDCPANVGYVFAESEGIVSIEFEDSAYPDGWVLKTDVSGVSGDGYLQWEGSPSLGSPGNGTITFPIRIATTGTYRFTWYSSFRKGDNGTEHNDSWLRFPDADDYFGRQGDGSTVYPAGSGKEPNPNGASADGWFKIYRSGNDNAFSWQARTSDNDPHDIYVTFSMPGIYLMEVSARSDFHGIDRILLFREDISQNMAIDRAAEFSVKETCN